MISRQTAVRALFFSLLLAPLALCTRAWSQCEGFGPMGPNPPSLGNVYWTFKDSVSACPAGDSLFAGRPARLRITVYYSDGFDCNRVGVPPESIWVTVATIPAAGNLKVNDEGARTFADDSTDSGGTTRITVPSFSGCGKCSLHVFVSGVEQGVKIATVRTADSDGNGRVESTEGSPTCDLNYDGIFSQQDKLIRAPHVTDWHRNALHGTLVRRTNLAETGSPNQENAIGAGDISWSPSGRRIAFSKRNAQHRCKVHLVASDPSGGNTPQQFTWTTAPIDSNDYDPSWSPLGDEIFFGRFDRVIYREEVPSVNPGSPTPVYSSPLPTTNAAISPDGSTVVFSQYDGVQFHIFTVPVSGGSPRQITSGSSFWDIYPKWSPDGQMIVFDRLTLATLLRGLHTVTATQDTTTPPTPLYAPTNQHAILPFYAEDGKIVVAGVGSDQTATVTHTLDPGLAPGPKPVTNYGQFTFSQLSPRTSPDGTRFGLLAKSPTNPSATLPQLWASRRNMSLPPQFTSIGGQSVADSTARVYFTVIESLAYNFVVAATDPENDPLTYAAFFLQLGMAFDSGTRTFTWTPPAGTAGNTYNVKFHVRTPSGGSDAVIALLTVQQSLSPAARAIPTPPEIRVEIDLARGSTGFRIGSAPGLPVRIVIFDVAGRQVARLDGVTGGPLRWDGRDPVGRTLPSGVYFYRLHIADRVRAGTVVLLR